MSNRLTPITRQSTSRLSPPTTRQSIPNRPFEQTTNNHSQSSSRSSRSQIPTKQPTVNLSQPSTEQYTGKRSQPPAEPSTSKRTRSRSIWKDAINRDMPGANYFLSTIPSKFDRLDYLKSRNATSDQKEALEFEWTSWMASFKESGVQCLRDASLKSNSSGRSQTFWDELTYQETIESQHRQIMDRRKLELRSQNVDQFGADGAAMTREIQKDMGVEVTLTSASAFLRTTSSAPIQPPSIGSSSSNSEPATDSYSYTIQIQKHFLSNFSSFADEPWTLSSGLVVDDVLWEYALTLQMEAPVHSFLIDCSNPNVRALFTDADWKEITGVDRKSRPSLPDWILSQLIAYSQKNTISEMHNFLRSGWAHLLQPSDDSSEEEAGKDQEKDEDAASDDDSGEEDYKDQVSSSGASAHSDDKTSEDILYKENLTMTLYRAVLNIYAELSSNSQEIRGHQNPEGWFATHVSDPLIDGLLGDLSNVQLLRGEKMSLSSSARKNLGRDVTSSKAFGRKLDGIFLSRNSSREYGAIEVGRKDEGAIGTKVLTDSLKTAKVLKDMFDHIFLTSKSQTFVKKRLEIVGILQSALRLQFVSVDFVAGRFLRMNEEKTLEVPRSLGDVRSLMLLIKEILVLGLRLERAEEIAKVAVTLDDKCFLNDLYDLPSTPPPNPTPNPATLQTPEKKASSSEGSMKTSSSTKAKRK
ncbi:hypothetical protein EMPS_00129 [Entomortierella parvispora]|uniref:Uncharacterized protein n=1 Tax=Entomortierella parvispora TaxID=205924 RepID=A0A9P3H158_9FUNG|nr:hypothetical protein EMPS_00129 [Entomortierella parvispora]